MQGGGGCAGNEKSNSYRKITRLRDCPHFDPIFSLSLKRRGLARTVRLLVRRLSFPQWIEVLSVQVESI